METIKAIIHDISRGGSGVARLESGEILFVPFTAPGDEIEAKVLDKKKNFSNGEIVTLLKPSPLRIEAPCPVFTKCGGCTWQHLPYSFQFETKKTGVLHALKRVGINTESVPIDDIPASNQYHYRNRIQLRGISATREIGYSIKGSPVLIPIESCPIADPRINDALPALAKEGFEKYSDEFKLEIEVSENGKVRAAWNKPHAAFGFRQVNDEQNLKLQAWIKAHLKPASILFDLYGGFGNLSVPVSDQFREVRCVDVSVPRSSEVSVPKNFHFDKKDIGQWCKAPHPNSYLTQTASFILDPPREGLGNFFVGIEAKISKLKVESIILVSCDVDSFTRDTSRFLEAGYRLDRMAVLDLFPQTPHVESLALFSK